MTEALTPSLHIANFIERWAASGAAERANYQIFLTDVPFPDSVRFRIPLRDLEREEARELLRKCSKTPQSIARIR
ncbi:MAG: hypothetical protein WCF57_13635 [Pyrinomonadaceae bacterium]